MNGMEIKPLTPRILESWNPFFALNKKRPIDLWEPIGRKGSFLMTQGYFFIFFIKMASALLAAASALSAAFSALPAAISAF